MGSFFAYILKTALCLIAYYLFYKLLLSRETFHHFNRMTLVSLMLLSFLLPMFGWAGTLIGGKDALSLQITWEGLRGQVLEDGSASSSFNPAQSILAVLILIYIGGTAFFLLRTLCAYASLIRILSKGHFETLPDGTMLLLSDDETAPFSWLRYVVVNRKDYAENGRAILMHELGHIRHRHTLDLLLTEIAVILQWFNPAVWLIRRELQVIHEYEADEAVLDGGVDPKSYQMLLIKKAAGSRLQSITNCLHQSSIKKRITMMLKKKSNPWARAKLLFAVPVAAVSVAVFATPEASALTTEISDCKVSIIFSDVQKDGQFSADEGKIVHYEATMKPAEDDSPVFTVVEQQPEFPGGEVALWEFMKNSLHYPEDALKTGTEGRVIISFIVEKDGSISSPVIEKSPHESLSKEAIRIINSMPKWKPGMQRGQVVRVKYVLPISFRLN
ncbi:MAG: M56 family metallopeptidase [Bacteroidales bacterium]|nr:M56 family metallopeptidase [Bacteroidales bacterium]